MELSNLDELASVLMRLSFDDMRDFASFIERAVNDYDGDAGMDADYFGLLMSSFVEERLSAAEPKIEKAA